MKVSPVPSLGTTVAGVDAQAARVESIRSMRMSTNATPGQIVPETTEELPISDANKEPNPVVEDTQPISPQFAALAKQRRALQQEKRAFEDAKKAFEATKSQGSDSVPMSRLKSEPLKVLLESGVTYDQLTEAILANQGNPELNALKAEIAALKEGVDKKFSESELQEREQLFKEVARDAQSIIASRLDDFELIQKMDRVPVAVEIWKKEFEEYANSSNQLAALKELYTDDKDYMKNAVYAKNPFLAWFLKTKSPDGFAGKYIPVPLEYGNPQGRAHVFANAQNQQTASDVVSYFVYAIQDYQL
jgi:hypothetical protein